MEMKKLSKDDLVFSTGETVKDGIFYVLLSTDVKDITKKKSYMANTIIEEMKVYNGQGFTFSENYFADQQGYIGKAKIPNKKVDQQEESLKRQKK